MVHTGPLRQNCCSNSSRPYWLLSDLFQMYCKSRETYAHFLLCAHLHLLIQSQYEA